MTEFLFNTISPQEKQRPNLFLTRQKAENDHVVNKSKCQQLNSVRVSDALHSLQDILFSLTKPLKPFLVFVTLRTEDCCCYSEYVVPF